MNSEQHPENTDPVNLAELQSAEQELLSEINHLHHELRRVRDGLQRAGGASHELEQRVRQLSSNIELCESELKVNQKQQVEVSIYLTD